VRCVILLLVLSEMRALTASKVWLAKKRLEGVLHAIAPSVWVPEYTLVAFTRTPYHEARKRAAKQDK
jgi:kynurenine 3-monooxygenase